MMQNAVIRVAVIECDPLRFIGLRTLLESERDFELASVPLAQLGKAGNIDVALLYDATGRELVNLMDNITTRCPDLRVLVTGPGASDELILIAVAAGAKGYVSEAAPATELASAVRIVNQGLLWAPRRVLATLMERSRGLVRSNCPVSRADLSDREKQVLRLLVHGRSNKEIAVPLGIEERTVKAHVTKLMRKVGVQNRIALSIHAINHSLVAAE
jgi:DNA-binding NarL/FixJ family response regulator